MATAPSSFIRASTMAIELADDQADPGAGLVVTGFPDSVAIGVRGDDGTMLTAILSFDRLDELAHMLADFVEASTRLPTSGQVQ